MREKHKTEKQFLYALAKESKGFIDRKAFDGYVEVREKDDSWGSLTQHFTLVNQKIIDFIIKELKVKSASPVTFVQMGDSNFRIRPRIGNAGITSDLVYLEVASDTRGWDGSVNLCTAKQLSKFEKNPQKLVISPLHESEMGVEMSYGHLMLPPSHLL